MTRANDGAKIIGILAGVKRATDDLAPNIWPRMTTGQVAMRALVQGLGSYAFVELLNEVHSPVLRAAIAAGLAHAGQKGAEAPDASAAQRLFCDALLCAALPVAAIGVVEAAITAIRDLHAERAFGHSPRVFVSHSWSESQDFFNLKARLQAQLTYFDHSVHVGKGSADLSDDQLEARLRQHMRGVHVLLVLAHPRAVRSVWVRREIEMAVSLGKPIVAVRPRGQRNASLHPVLRDTSVEQVGWDAPAVARRISKWSDITRMVRGDD